jgi:hypothetical protein
MRTLINSGEFKRLKKLDEVFQKKYIPFDFKLKYSKTEGYFVVVHGDVKSDFATIAIWPLYKDFEVLADMIEKEMQK